MKTPVKTPINSVENSDKRPFRWHWIGDDWVDYGSGELLSGFTPSDSIRELVKRITADARAAPIPLQTNGHWPTSKNLNRADADDDANLSTRG